LAVKKYEAVVIFKSDEAAYREAKEFLRKELETARITVVKEDDMGDRLLATPIGKNDRGHYVLYTMETEPAQLHVVDRSLKLKPEILKFLFVRLDA
jgi:small subunit ribosomal protein S6